MQGDNNQPGRSSYLDFELDIDDGRGREYPVAALCSPPGKAHRTIRFSFGKLLTDSRLDRLWKVKRPVP